MAGTPGGGRSTENPDDGVVSPLDGSRIGRVEDGRGNSGDFREVRISSTNGNEVTAEPTSLRDETDRDRHPIVIPATFDLPQGHPAGSEAG